MTLTEADKSVLNHYFNTQTILPVVIADIHAKLRGVDVVEEPKKKKALKASVK